MVLSTVNGVSLAKQRIKNKNAGCTTYDPLQSTFNENSL